MKSWMGMPQHLAGAEKEWEMKMRDGKPGPTTPTNIEFALRVNGWCFAYGAALHSSREHWIRISWAHSCMRAHPSHWRVLEVCFALPFMWVLHYYYYFAWIRVVFVAENISWCRGFTFVAARAHQLSTQAKNIKYFMNLKWRWNASATFQTVDVCMCVGAWRLCHAIVCDCTGVRLIATV